MVRKKVPGSSLFVLHWQCPGELDKLECNLIDSLLVTVFRIFPVISRSPLFQPQFLDLNLLPV